MKSTEEILLAFYRQHGNKTKAAKQTAEKIGIDYSDSFRRVCSKTINKAMGKRETPPEKPSKSKWEEDTSKGTAVHEFTVSKPIKTLEEAIKAGDVDTEVWDVDRWVWNSWGVTAFHNGQPIQKTNYQVKMWLKRKEKTLEEMMQDLLPALDTYTPKETTDMVGSGIGVVSLADFHVGASVKDLLRTPDFNVHVLIDYLSDAVGLINSGMYEEVHVNLLGDFYESISGMNHENTFKSLGDGMWGANAMIVANEIIAEHLLSKIHNLTAVNIVSGNHDRMTASNKLDNTGEGGKVLWYMLQKDFPDIPIDYHNSVLVKEIDGINYLLTHGDKGYSKKDFSKFVLDYGRTDIYNMVLEGHLHSRFVKKVTSYGKKVYGDLEMVSHDDLSYRKIVVPSLFTGNWFSESNGYASAAGFIISQNNGKGRPHVVDISL